MKHSIFKLQEIDQSYRCSRRSFLLYTMLGALGVELSACTPTEIDNNSWLELISPYPQQAATLGRVYLAQHPEENKREVLLTKVDEALQTVSGTTGSAGSNRTLEALEQAVRNDYKQGRMVIVDQWVLGTTEARLYALLALRQG
jgi:hypothetical protein